MPSKRLAVLLAVKAMIAAALPGVPLVGLAGDDAAPDRIDPLGRIVIRSGDPGEPSVDLSPLTYNYEHAIPIEISAYASATETGEAIVDRMFGAIGAAIVADRTLGGIVEFIDAAAPITDDDEADGAAPLRNGAATLVAIYSTSTPL